MMRWIAGFALLCGAFSQAGELPRYSLPVGRTLTYESESKSDQGGGRQIIQRGQAQVTVVRENSDGSRRIIIRTSQILDQGIGQKTERTQIEQADVFPDGRIVAKPGTMPGADRLTFFPQLPADQNQVSSGWQFTSNIDGGVLTYKTKSDTPDQFVFTCDEGGAMSRIYVLTNKHTLHFNRAKGVMEGEESEISQDYGFHSKGSGTTTLKKDEMIDAVKAQALGVDYDAWFTARDQYRQLVMQIAEEPAQAQQIMDKARAVMEKGSKEARAKDVADEFTRALTDHEASGRYAIEDAQNRVKLLNKPAANWSAIDLDGKEWSQTQLRGKVVVMDFWYRGCGWCMYAMPTVKQLAIEYKDKPVVFLGMNTDRIDNDAQFVVKEFGLPYAQLKATEIAAQLNVQAFPTMIIIDQNGVIRNMDVGYSPDLHDKVTKKLDRLLEKAR